jgi:hypothetical protein
MAYQPTPIVSDDQSQMPPQNYAGVPAGQSIPAPQLTLPPTTPPQIPAAPPPSTGLNPQQYTTETVGRIGRKGELVGKQGEIEMQAGQELADKYNQEALEDNQHHEDYQRFLGEQTQRQDDDHQRIISAYNDYAKKAGSLKDPSSQFWEDKGMGARILSGFAAFASGMGASMIGKGGNPYLDYLHNLIDKNFEAHKQNIRDLYDKQVAAGKISDDDQTWSKYLQEARVKGYDIAIQHIIPELNGIKSKATGQLQQNLALQTINGLEQESLDQRQKLAQSQAAQAAAGEAQRRADAKAAGEALAAALSRHSDLGEDEARVEAAKDVMAMPNIPRTALGRIMGSIGAHYDTGSDKWIFPELPKPAGGGSEPPHYDENGNLVLPTVDINGKRIKPEERDKMTEATKKLTVVDPDTGKPRLAISDKLAEKYVEHSQAYPEAQRLFADLQKAWDAGDEGTYHQKRQALIELAPKIYGFTRGPSGAQAGEGSGDESTYKATVAGQLPEDIPMVSRITPGGTKGSVSQGFNTITGFGTPSAGEIGRGNAQLSGFKQHLLGIHQSMNQATFGAPQTQSAQTQPAQAPHIDFTPGTK